MIFLSSDKSPEEMAAYRAAEHGDWLALPWGDELAKKLKRQHRIWSGRETGTFGYGRRAGVPSVVVIDEAGQEVSFLVRCADDPTHLSAPFLPFDPDCRRSLESRLGPCACTGWRAVRRRRTQGVGA